MAKKIKTVGTISEFMNLKQEAPRDYVKPAIKVCIIVGAAAISLGFGDVSFAAAGAVNGAVTAKVVQAFNPLIELARALSYPIGLVMMLGGGLFVMIGNADKGFSMIQKAGLGYVLIQMLPVLMDLLVEIAKTL
ncbi:hypothetical protein FZD47_02585 [Bacillus infantis]|uniref:Uncharacterized protein n=1 Tax=Bacillus infantis TaxID=324767 RepID=A0A5D4SVZ7_9BACI|nr:hypothetical protein [Bacillus infantis]TYS66392.1 hypothetical protein FZD47_02585 [Bacillus infantis]